MTRPYHTRWLLEHAWLLALPGFLIFPGAAPCQDVFGSVRGIVSDSTGATAAGARVFIVGTAFAVTAGPDGRYAIDFVPGGRYTVRAELGEYAATEQPAVLVLGGGTLRLDLRLGAAAPSRRPLFAAPQGFASGLRIDGDALRDLPIDDPRQALMLAPGVVLHGGGLGIDSPPDLSIHGGPPGEASVYIDGAPARYETFGTPAIALGANTLFDASVTTGVPAAFVPDAHAGVIGYITRAGGPTIAAGIRGESDEAFGNAATVGYNRIEGAAGGPVPGVPRLTWFLSATAQGQRSRYRGPGAADEPTFVMAGPDTVVSDTAANGAVTQTVLPRFAQASGVCGEIGNSNSAIGTAIGDNYGFSCFGLRRPLDWSSLVRGHAKVLYTYGEGSSLSLTGVTNDFQQRTFPGQAIADPPLYRGARTWSRLAVANWSQHLGRVRGGSLRLNVNLSIGTDREIAGPLTPASELANRDPALGIEFSRLQFTGLDVFPYPITDQVIRDIRSNTPNGLSVPFPNRPDLNNAQTGRLNPFGMQSGWFTSGLRTTLSLVSERRLNGRWLLDWQPGGVHRVTVGGDVARTDASFYTSTLNAQIGLDALIVHPRRWGLFASDRLDIGELAIDVGIRYDHFKPGGQFPRVPGFVSSHPAWNPNAAVDDTAYASSVARVFTPGRSRGAVSPRVRLAYALSARTGVRFAVGQVVEPPSLAVQFANVNSDLSFTNTADVFGRDVDYGKSTLVELSVRHAFTPDLGLDASVYHKDDGSQYGSRFLPFVSPRQASETLSVNALTPLDVHQSPGVDVAIDWRRGDVLTSTVAYSFVRTGWKGAITHTTTHALYAAVALRVPGGWKHGTLLGAVGRDGSAFLTLRATSGLPYTRLVNNGTGATVAQGLVGPAAENLNASHLPWTKSLDLRVTKTIHTGRQHWTAYADLRNVLNFTNLVDVFSETGTTSNDLFRAKLLSPELGNLQAEANAAGALAPDGTVDLHTCSAWGNRQNCVALLRVENRFGDGNGLYTPAEQQRALSMYYESFFGPWRFYGPGRTARVGIQLEF